MCFIPVQLGLNRTSIRQSHERFAFEFAPSATPICFPQSAQLTNFALNRNDFDIGDIADDFEVHTFILAPAFRSKLIR